MSGQVVVIDHPLIQHKLSSMRDRERSTKNFRQLLHEIAMLMGYEIFRDLPTDSTDIETPLARITAPILRGKKMAVVPILRAGLIMADGLLELTPSARVGHIGLYRDPTTKRPVEYLVKLPDTKDRSFIVVDPMLATGHSAVRACEILLEHGADITQIRFMALVAAPEGIAVFHARFPQIPIYTAAVDSHLNDHCYIVPGLGDAGDRLYGTS